MRSGGQQRQRRLREPLPIWSNLPTWRDQKTIPEQWVCLNSNYINSLANTVNPSMTKACLQPCLQQTKSMVRGYCTLFLIKIDLWSRGALPIDRSPWSMDQGSRMGWWSWLGLILLFN
jgi:hypothetical protein